MPVKWNSKLGQIDPEVNTLIVVSWGSFIPDFTGPAGSGIGSWTRSEIKELLNDILPTAFKLAAQNKLVVDTISIKLKDIEKLYDMDVPDGKRLVVIV